MTDESLITQVMVGDDEVELEIRLEDDIVLSVRLDGKKVFSGDWQNNLLKMFKRALELWDEGDTEN